MKVIDRRSASEWLREVGEHGLTPPGYNCLIAQLAAVYQVFLRLNVAVAGLNRAGEMLLVHLVFVGADSARAVDL